jgi:hypothetical protein
MPSEMVVFGSEEVSRIKSYPLDAKLRKEKSTVATRKPASTTGVNYLNGYGLLIP